MRKTDIIWNCKSCNREFELFSDDCANDQSICWNYCPHCGTKNDIWIRFKSANDKLKIGIGYLEAQLVQYEN